MSLECKQNLRMKRSTREKLDMLSGKFGLPREQLTRIILEAALPLYEAETPEGIKEAQRAQRVLALLHVE